MCIRSFFILKKKDTLLVYHYCTRLNDLRLLNIIEALSERYQFYYKTDSF